MGSASSTTSPRSSPVLSSAIDVNALATVTLYRGEPVTIQGSAPRTEGPVTSVRNGAIHRAAMQSRHTARPKVIVLCALCMARHDCGESTAAADTITHIHHVSLRAMLRGAGGSPCDLVAVRPRPISSWRSQPMSACGPNPASSTWRCRIGMPVGRKRRTRGGRWSPFGHNET